MIRSKIRSLTPSHRKISEEKKTIRDQIEKYRRTLFPSSLKKKASSNFHSLYSQPWFASAKTVMLYASQSFEFPTQDFFEWLKNQGKEIYFPVVERESLNFLRVESWSDLHENKMRILEPHFGRIISPDQIDIFFVPLVAFDSNGNRLGRGGGFFDRLFSMPLVQGVRIGLGFEWQHVVTVPTQSHDIQMNFILTDKKLRTT